MRTRAASSAPPPRPPRDWLLVQAEAGPDTLPLPALPEVDTTFERVVLVGSALLSGSTVLSAVSGLLGFLLGLSLGG